MWCLDDGKILVKLENKLEIAILDSVRDTMELSSWERVSWTMESMEFVLDRSKLFEFECKRLSMDESSISAWLGWIIDKHLPDFGNELFLT